MARCITSRPLAERLVSLVVWSLVSAAAPVQAMKIAWLAEIRAMQAS